MPSTTRAATRGPYRTGIRRREQIVAAAIEVFGEFGFAGGSIRTIAERVGVSHATLLQHFGTKEGLLLAVLAEWDRRTVEARLAGASGLDYFRRLPEVMGAHLAQRGLLELFTTIAAEASSPTTLAMQLQQAVNAGEVTPLSPAEIDVEVRLVTAVLDGIGLQWLLDPSTDVVASISTYITRTITGWRRSR